MMRINIQEKLATVILHISVISMLFSIDACKKPADDDDVPQLVDISNPVETNPPNTSYQPAFTGQTRIGGVSTETRFTETVFATGLSNPWGMTNLPDGRIIVTQKSGTFRIVGADGTTGSPITGIPAVNSAGQGGLLDVAVDPDFANNRMLYWSFSRNIANGNTTAVAKGRLSNDETQIENAVIIYTALPGFNSSLHFGSRLAWDSQGNLFVSTGERSNTESRPEAQELDAALGKVVRITKDGAAAAGNPTFNAGNALPEIYSYGHRNPQGLAIHPGTGELWLSEMGPRGGDEINRITAGKNYGWPAITYGIEYNGSPVVPGETQKDGMEQPVYYWDPVVSPSGITFNSGKMISEWQNNLFVAALSGMHVIRLVIENDKVVGEERLLSSYGKRFRDVLEGNDGAIYAVTDEANASIYRIGL